MKKIIRFVVITSVAIIWLVRCSQRKVDITDGKETTVRLGIIGEDTDVWDNVRNRLKKENVSLEYMEFTDHNQSNVALTDGSIDLNFFQHQSFLNNYNREYETDLVSARDIVDTPLGTYSSTLRDVANIKDGAKVAIPNDITNDGRALLLLQIAGPVKMDKTKRQAPIISDITENRKNLDISESDASQTAHALSGVGISVINSGVAVDAGFNPVSDAILLEPVDDHTRPYVSIIVARKEDEKNKTYQKIVDACRTENTVKVIEKTPKGLNVSVWETFGRK